MQTLRQSGSTRLLKVMSAMVAPPPVCAFAAKRCLEAYEHIALMAYLQQVQAQQQVVPPFQPEPSLSAQELYSQNPPMPPSTPCRFQAVHQTTSSRSFLNEADPGRGPWEDFSSVVLDRGMLQSPVPNDSQDWIPQTPSSPWSPLPHEMYVRPLTCTPVQSPRAGGVKRPLPADTQMEVQHARVPTPSRSSARRPCPAAVREVGVQVDRRSLEKHAACHTSRLNNPSGSRVEKEIEWTGGLADVCYPKALPAASSAPAMVAASSRSALAQALSAAVSEEFRCLREAWNLGAPGQELRAEEAVAGCLKTISRRAERRCILLALRAEPDQTAVAKSEVCMMQSKVDTLEAELSLARERLAQLRTTQGVGQLSVAAQLGVNEPQKAFSQLLASLQAPASSRVAGSSPPASEQYLQRLGVAEMALQKLQISLEETDLEISTRERQAFEVVQARFPHGPPNLEQAMLRLR